MRSVLRPALLLFAVSLTACPPDDPPPAPAPASWFDAWAADPATGVRDVPGGTVSVLAGPPTSGTWLPQGPGPANGGQVRNLDPDDSVVGAVHTVVAHPSDPDVLYVGSVNGGIWRTANATDERPTWTPLIDDFPGLSIGALEMDPNDADVLLAGQGGYSSFSRTSDRLTGALLSTNGGTTWAALDHPSLVGENLSGVAARGDVLVVSSRDSGIFRSDDLGATWGQVSGGNGLPNGGVFDLVGDPTDDERLYASVADTGIYLSTDTGENWQDISSGDPTLDGVITDPDNNNTEMAVSPVNGRLWVSVLLDGQSQYIGYTDDQGGTWTPMDLPLTRRSGMITDASNETPIVVTTSFSHLLSDDDVVTITGVTGNTAANGTFAITEVDFDSFSLNGSAGNGDYTGGGTFTYDTGLNPRVKPGGQGGNHHSIRADPALGDIVYVGGDRQDLPSFIGATGFTGNLWRGDAGVAATGAVPSPQWEHLTDLLGIAEIPGGGTAAFTAPHADSREMVFDANGDIVEVNDGGVTRRTNPEDNTGDWFSLVGDLQVTEIHDIAWDTVSNVLISGNQDTGTTEQRETWGTTWRSASTADGGDVQVDDTSLPGMSIRYSSNQNLGSFRRRTCSAANLCGGTQFPDLDVLSGDPDPVPQFVTPVELNHVDPTRLVIGYGNGPYESLDQGDTLDQVPGPATVNRNAMYYGHAGDADFLVVGADDRVFTRTGGIGSNLVDTGGPGGGGDMLDIAVDPADLDQLFATDVDSVFESPDGGATWNDITGDLPAEAANFRTLAFLENAIGSDLLVLGTNDGPYVTPMSSLGSWFPMGGGMPSAMVWDLDYDATDDVLAAGTLGRSAWILRYASGVAIPPNQAPVALCEPFAIEVDATCMADVMPSDVDAGSFDPDGDALTLALDPPGPYGVGEHEVALVATDDEGAIGFCDTTISVNVSDPPPVEALADTYARKGDKNDNEGASTFMRMGSFDYYDFIRFDPAEYNPNGNLHCVEIEASLEIQILEAKIGGQEDTRVISLHRMTSDWDEGNAWHYDAPVEVPGTGSGATWYCAVDTDISNDVRECAIDWDLSRETPQPWDPTPTASRAITDGQVGSETFDVVEAFEDFVDPMGATTDVGFALVKETHESADLRFGTREGGMPAVLDIDVIEP